jgi:hypothetical protein
MKKAESAFDKIKWCINDIEEFKDLIQINDSEIELDKRYSLLTKITGQKIKNRIENLIIACWSAKDYLKKEITNQISESAGRVFEIYIFEHEETELIQYLADSFKHGGIDDRFLNNNKYKPLKPYLENTVLRLSNESVPGELKPTSLLEGESVPPFQVKGVRFEIDGKVYQNYDTINLTMKILDKDKNYISDTTTLVNKYVDILKRNFNRMMR